MLLDYLVDKRTPKIFQLPLYVGRARSCSNCAIEQCSEKQEGIWPAWYTVVEFYIRVGNQ